MNCGAAAARALRKLPRGEPEIHHMFTRRRGLLKISSRIALGKCGRASARARTRQLQASDINDRFDVSGAAHSTLGRGLKPVPTWREIRWGRKSRGLSGTNQCKVSGSNELRRSRGTGSPETCPCGHWQPDAKAAYNLYRRERRERRDFLLESIKIYAISPETSPGRIGHSP